MNAYEHAVVEVFGVLSSQNPMLRSGAGDEVADTLLATQRSSHFGVVCFQA